MTEEQIANAVIAGTDVSDFLRKVELWRKTTDGIGTFLIELQNENGIWNRRFHGQDVVNIKSQDAVLMNGYVDLVQTHNEDDAGNAEGSYKLHETLLIVGRDFGQDLQNKFFDQIVQPAPADLILKAILKYSGSEINLNLLPWNTAPTIPYDCKSEYNLDSFRNILELIDFDGYVDPKKQAQIYPIGSIDSGITLQQTEDDPTNNILKVIDHDEEDKTDLRNYIVAFGDNVDDHWTEGNAADWTAVTNTGTVTKSDYASSTWPVPYAGVYAVSFVPTVPNGLLCGKLVFPLYNHNSLDFSQTSLEHISLAVYQHIGANPSQNIPDGALLVLIDNQGNQIWWKNSDSQPTGYTGNPFATGPFLWDVFDGLGTSNAVNRAVGVPVGFTVLLWEGQSANKQWNCQVGVAAKFTWNIKEIQVIADGNTGASHNGMYVDQLLVDGLQIPVPAIAVSTDSSKFKRKLIIPRTDITSQLELQSYADSQLRLRNSPIERLHLWAAGDAGLIEGSWNWLPGYSCNVNIPSLSVNGQYRFMQLHHILARPADVSGWNHVVECDLVPKSLALSTQVWRYGTQSQTAILRRLRDRLRMFEAAAVANREWYSSLP